MSDGYQFGTGNVVNTRDFGFAEAYEIQLERDYEGGWVANCPECGLAEHGETREEVLRALVDNLKLYKRRLSE